MTRTPAEAAKELDALLADVAGALYTVDSAGDLLFVRSQADAGNGTAKAAIASLEVAWERYPLAKEAVDRLATGLASGDHGVVNELLGPAAVTLPDGTATAIGDLLTGLKQRVDAIAKDVGGLADAARQALTQLDAVRSATEEIVVRADAVAASDDPEVTALQAAIERATAAIAADPTNAPGLDTVNAALAAARERIDDLERRQRELPAALSAAAAQLDEIEALRVRGADALALAHAKIASPVGLLEPVAVDGHGDRALRPWLIRIQRQADSGAWEAASAEMAAWKQAADIVHAEAKRVADANAAPVARRNELRGLLDAYRAKSLAFGRDEDGRLARLHAAAKDALYTAPCALDEAERMVREYLSAVNAAASGRES